MKNSLVSRLTVCIALLVTATAVVVLLVGSWLLKRQGIQSFDLMQRVECVELAGLLGGDAALESGQVAKVIEVESDSDFALYFIQVRNDAGDIIYRSANLGDRSLPVNTGAGENWTVRIKGIGAVRISEVRSGAWRIQVASALEPLEHVLREYAKVSAAIVAVTALVSLLLGYAFSRMMLAPVRAIERTARRIRADNLSERIDVHSWHGELAALAALLNNTFDHLEQSFAQVRRFTAEASHELKTPLALIRLEAEKLRRRVAGDPGADALLSDLLEETDRMGRIIESLLFIAKVEGGALVLERRAHDMRAFVAEFSEDARALSEDRGMIFETGRNDAGAALIEPHIMRQLLLNLVSNALAASRRGGKVVLDSCATERGWMLAVSDEGDGLPPEMLERVFERFTRYTPSASGEGHGLGLAICRSIAGLHGGTIRAENRGDRRGLRVVVEW